jgi:hypothetical protein
MRPLILVTSALVVCGCAPALKVPPMPIAMKPTPVADVALWAAASMPAEWKIITFKFRQTNLVDADSHGGSGWVFLSRPDSLHLDFHTALGLISGAASVLGDSALWAEPKEQVQKLVPSYHLLWAMVGVYRPPAAGWAVQSHMDGKVATVLYTHGSDTVLYSSERSKLVTYVVEGGRPIGRVWTTFDPLRQLVSSTLLVLTAPFKVDVTFDGPGTKKRAHIDRDTWNASH